MRPELFTITPELSLTTADLGMGRQETIIRPMLTMACNLCSYSFRYPAIALPDLLAHAEAHSADHPLPEPEHAGEVAADVA